MRRLLCYAAPVEAGPLQGSNVLSEVDFLCVGVGIASAAMSIAKKLSRCSYDQVVSFGVAGAWPARLLDEPTQGLELGECVLISADRFVDLGVETPGGFESLAAMSIGEVGPWAMNPQMTEAAIEKLGCKRVDAVTVARGSGTDAAARAIGSRSSVAIERVVESMEGAALAMACQHFGVPMIQLRAISNFVGERERGQWSLDRACSSVQDGVRRLLG